MVIDMIVTGVSL